MDFYTGLKILYGGDEYEMLEIINEANSHPISEHPNIQTFGIHTGFHLCNKFYGAFEIIYNPNTNKWIFQTYNKGTLKCQLGHKMIYENHRYTATNCWFQKFENDQFALPIHYNKVVTKWKNIIIGYTHNQKLYTHFQIQINNKLEQIDISKRYPVLMFYRRCGIYECCCYDLIALEKKLAWEVIEQWHDNLFKSNILYKNENNKTIANEEAIIEMHSQEEKIYSDIIDCIKSNTDNENNYLLFINRYVKLFNSIGIDIDAQMLSKTILRAFLVKENRDKSHLEILKSIFWPDNKVNQGLISAFKPLYRFGVKKQELAFYWSEEFLYMAHLYTQTVKQKKK